MRMTLLSTTIVWRLQIWIPLRFHRPDLCLVALNALVKFAPRCHCLWMLLFWIATKVDVCCPALAFVCVCVCVIIWDEGEWAYRVMGGGTRRGRIQRGRGTNGNTISLIKLQMESYFRCTHGDATKTWFCCTIYNKIVFSFFFTLYLCKRNMISLYKCAKKSCFSQEW